MVLSPKSIYADMVATLTGTAPLYATVERWATHFKIGKEKLEDDDNVDDPQQQQLRKTLLMCTES